MKKNHCKHAGGNIHSRRKFVSNTLQVAGASALLSIPGSSWAASFGAYQKEYTIQNIIDIIIKAVPGGAVNDSVDVIKIGSAADKVTGIVTTMFPTVAVIKKAIALHANLVIPHEPVFYNHPDKKDWLPANKVQQEKLHLIEQHNITIWRAHDYMHAMQPDSVILGVVQKLGWAKYYSSGKTFTIPSGLSLMAIAQHCKKQLKINHLRVVGNLQQHCKKIALLPGAWGGRDQISTIIEDKPDVLIVGEVDEWETAEYVRDARLLGDDISLVILGHVQSEEPGMEWLCNWLKPQVPGLPVFHISSNDPFTWV